MMKQEGMHYVHQGRKPAPISPTITRQAATSTLATILQELLAEGAVHARASPPRLMACLELRGYSPRYSLCAAAATAARPQWLKPLAAARSPCPPPCCHPCCWGAGWSGGPAPPGPLLPALGAPLGVSQHSASLSSASLQSPNWRRRWKMQHSAGGAAWARGVLGGTWGCGGCAAGMRHARGCMRARSESAR